jgi:hypothetical protein
MALIADPSPRSEIDASLGTGELSDDEYAALGAGVALGLGAADGLGTSTQDAMARSLSVLHAGSGTQGAHGVGPLVGGPLGAVGGATRGIGDQVRGALSQFPALTPPTPAVNAGPPGG